MKRWLGLLVLVSLQVQARAEISVEQELARFQALSQAKTLSEFEAARRRYDLAEAATVACQRELATGRVPVNCYVLLKIDGNKDQNLQISAAVLAERCEKAAGQEMTMPHAEHLHLLPEKCRQKLRERGRLLAYKFGKDLE